MLQNKNGITVFFISFFKVFRCCATVTVINKSSARNHYEYGNCKIKNTLNKICGNPPARFAEPSKSACVKKQDA